MMKKILLVLLVPFVYVKTETQRKIDATGGGILKPGQDFQLTLDAGEEAWERCYWFFDGNRCRLDLNSETGIVKKKECNLKDLDKVVDITGNNKCAIKVTDPDDKYKTAWSARFDIDMHSTELELELAEQISSQEISIDPSNVFQAGISGNVSCKFNGGLPDPNVTLLLDGNVPEDESFIVKEDDIVLVQDENKAFGKVFSIAPDALDNNKKVSCKAVQYDKLGDLLFDEILTKEIALNVTFAPRLLTNFTSLQGKVAKSASTSVKFISNPSPISFSLIIISNIADSETGNQTENESAKDIKEITIYPGSDGDKYKLSDVVEDDGDEFHVELEIKSLTAEDGENKDYRLEIINSLGTLDHYFDVDVVKEDDPTGSEGTNETEEGNENGAEEGESSGTTIVFVILAIVVVAALIMGCVYMYRANYRNSSVTPLSAQERRR